MEKNFVLVVQNSVLVMRNFVLMVQNSLEVAQNSVRAADPVPAPVYQIDLSEFEAQFLPVARAVYNLDLVADNSKGKHLVLHFL